MAAAAERGEELPASQAAAHDVWPICKPYWVAFWVLTESRPLAVGMGGAYPLPIPYSELSLYAKDHGQADTFADLDEFVFLVNQMDQAYIEHRYAENNT